MPSLSRTPAAGKARPWPPNTSSSSSQTPEGHNINNNGDDDDDQPSPGKRAKLHHTPHTYSPETLPTSPNNMYSFAGNVIDLTSSPPRKGGRGGTGSQQWRLSGTNNNTKMPAASSPHSTPSQASKKLVVKNLKQTPKHDPEQYLNQVWTQVDAALTTIFADDTNKYSLEELYRGVENVCRQNFAAELSKRLRARCADHVTKVIRPRLLKSKEGTPAEIVAKTVDEWLRWRKQNAVIKAIFFYLDRSYLLHSSTDQTIDEMCIALFRDHLFFHRELKAQIVAGTCGLLATDRGEQRATAFDPDLFRNVVSMFHGMTIYGTEIESKILAGSQTFFVDWAERHSEQDDLKALLTSSLELKASEIERCNKFSLPDTTKRELVRQIDTYLVENQVSRLTRTPDVAELVAANDVDTLQTLYEWLEVKDLGESLQGPVSQYIDAEGTQIIFDEKRENEMVVRLLSLKKQVDTIHERAFAKNKTLGHAMREAFSEFMNKNKRNESTGGAGNDKPGEMIAKYVDIILKGGTKAIPQAGASDNVVAAPTEDDAQRQDDEMDEDGVINRELDRVLDLFRFVQGKATFEAFYKKDLAKRLLMNRSASADAETSMLTRLRNNCGASFTHNLEQMFKDIERSREENAAYKMLLEDRNTKMAIDLSVNTLSAAAWPSYPDPTVEIPGDIQKATSDFEAHYRSKYAGRKLEWKHSLAHCQMRARFAAGQKELILSSFQAVVLLQFNDRGTDNAPLSYSHLQAATKLSDAELQRTLQSLACAKYRVLTKSPRGKQVAPTDRFAVNLAFTDARARIKINQIQLRETLEEQKQTHERVAADRQFETQAAIVRIMKAQKKIKHALLVAEVINALKTRGAINAEDIKKQIEKLIDKDYMERADDGFYEYLA